MRRGRVPSNFVSAFYLMGTESESPTMFACNPKIDFGGGAPTSPVANGIIYSGSPKFLASKNPPSAYGIWETKTNLLNTLVEDSGVMEEVYSPGNVKQGGLNRGLIETTAPIESVKAAVSKFGGIVAWKTNRTRTQSMERIKPMVEELEEVQEEILQYREQSEAAAESESQVSKELEHTKQQIEELKLALESAQTEEQRAKHDSELAKLRLEEMENDAITVAQLEATMAEHTAAISELKSSKEELETLHMEFASLVSERDSAMKNADDVIAASKEAEKALDELTTELVAIKESLESAKAAHIEAEEQRIAAALAKEQDCFNWKKELDDAEEEFCRLNLQIFSFEDLKSNMNTASTLLLDLKAEMKAYMETILKEMRDDQLTEGDVAEAWMRTSTTTQSEVDLTKRELEEVKLNIEKAVAEVECLKMAATSLKSELEEEKSTIAITKQRVGMLSIVPASLEAELENKMSEIFVVQGNVNEAQENMVELTNQLERAAQEADQAKSLARMALEELQKATIEAEKAKAERHTMESRLIASHKEIEAANASKMLALEAIKALQESDSARISKENSSAGVTLSLEEYNELSKCAYQAEEQANIRVTEAISQIEIAKESEAKSLEMLEEVNRDLVARQVALNAATEKADEAKEGKLAAEQELRTLRVEREQQWKDSESGQEESIPTISARTSTDTLESENGEHDVVPAPQVPSTEEPMQKSDSTSNSLPDSKEGKKKKKSFFPKMLTLLGKSKSSKKKST